MNLGLSPLSIGGKKSLPLMKQLEATMLAAVKQTGGAAWYVPDDFLTLGPELSPNLGNPFVDTTGITAFTSGILSVVNGMLRSGTTAGASQPMIANFAIPTTIGRTYKISVPRATKTTNVGGLFSLQASVNANGSAPFGAISFGAAGAGSYGLMEYVFTATATTTYVGLRADNGASGTSSDYSEWAGCSVREILSAKDFQDSQGTLPAFLGSTAGLIFDATAVTGQELIANPNTSGNWLAEGTTPPTAVNGSDIYLGKSCRSVTFPVIASGGYSVCRARDAESMFNVVAGTTYTASFEYALSRDLTTGEGITIAVTGVSGIFPKSLSAGAPGGLWSPGIGSQPALVTGGGISLRSYATVLNAPLTVYVRAVSVKVAGGVVASQSTAGNRPTVSCIPRKLGPELVGSGVTGWVASGSCTASVADSALTLSDASPYSGYAYKNISTTIGKSYVIQYQTVGAREGYFEVRNAANNANIATTQGYSGTGFGQRVVTFIADSASTMVRLSDGSSSAQSDVVIASQSVREVLEWSYALTFDGTNDSLAAPASIIGSNLSQPYTMIAWGRPGSIGATQRMVGDGLRAIGIDAAGKVGVIHNGPGGRNGPTVVAQGQPVIIEVAWDGSTSNLYLNGAVESSGAHAAPTGTAAATAIGQYGLSTAYWQGEIGGAVVCPAVMTDAQRAAVRKFAAAQMGLTL